MNKDNYDLCKACFDTNEDQDVVFEAQQYNRDAGKCGWRKKKCAGRAGAAKRHPPPLHHHHHHEGPPPTHCAPPHHHGPPPHHRHHYGKHGMMFAVQEDLKMTVDRSLMDVLKSVENSSNTYDDDVKSRGVEETKANEDGIIAKNNKHDGDIDIDEKKIENNLKNEEEDVSVNADDEGSWNVIDDEDESSSTSYGNISAILLARWDTQLAALAELGFTNTEKVLDVLETLQAANIGCESEDGVSLQQVVNYLFKNEA